MFAPEKENDANLMEELAIAIYLNITAFWLILNEFEFVKHRFDLVIKLDLFNIQG